MRPGRAEVPRADGAPGLLVADEVKDDPAAVEQAVLGGGRGAVEHAHQPALHVRRPAPDDPAVAALGLELPGALRGDDVVVPVVVDELGAGSDAAPHDRRRFQRSARAELDQLGREAQAIHRIAQDRGAASELAAGRVLRRDRHERFEQARHLLRAAVDPPLHLRAPVGHVAQKYRTTGGDARRTTAVAPGTLPLHARGRTDPRGTRPAGPGGAGGVHPAVPRRRLPRVRRRRAARAGSAVGPGAGRVRVAPQGRRRADEREPAAGPRDRGAARARRPVAAGRARAGARRAHDARADVPLPAAARVEPRGRRAG